MDGKTSIWTPSTFRVGIRIRFRIRFKIRVGFKGRIRVKDSSGLGRKEMFYLMMQSTDFIYSYMVSYIW